jgi:hypothetical protein
MAVAAFMLFAAGAAQAGPAVKKATGSIVMSGPRQAASFEAFERASNKGAVTYTNFEYAVDGTGVWVPAGTFDASFEYAGLCNGPCVHTLTISDFEPLSPNSVSFEGTGFYAPDPAWTETFSGKIVGDQIKFKMVPDDGGTKYGWTFTKVVGTIASDGSVDGTWNDSLLRTGIVEIADIGYEAFSYSAQVTCAEVTGSDAVFGFDIPIAPLAGTHVAVTVHDGGSSGVGNDTWAHTVGTCGDPGTNYPIVAGNLTVHN